MSIPTKVQHTIRKLQIESELDALKAMHDKGELPREAYEVGINHLDGEHARLVITIKELPDGA